MTDKTSVEEELKVDISAGDLEKVFNSFIKKFQITAVQQKYLPRAYYDTDGLELHAAHISLRVQYKPGKAGRLGGYEQTIKTETPAHVAGVLARKESKSNLSGRAPDLMSVTDPVTQGLVRPYLGKPLKHIFTAAAERRYFNVRYKGSVIEVAFDVGVLSLTDGSVHQNFAEIEVELKKGNAKALIALRDKILALAPSARAQTLSKAEQGVALYLQNKKPTL